MAESSFAVILEPKEIKSVSVSSFSSSIYQEVPHVQAGFRKGRGTGDQIIKICWIIDKARESRKISTSAS